MRPHEPENGGAAPDEPAPADATSHPNPRPLPRATTPLDPVTLKFEEVVYKLKIGRPMWWSGCCGSGAGGAEKVILNGITGMVGPGEMLAMLGPSGSGKTTLLTALGGRLVAGKLSGTITYNGQPFSRGMKRRTGFVAQDDVLYPHLTVRETLAFTALLRLPRSLSRAEKVRHAEKVMGDLGLARVAHTMIGGHLVRGVSGGERKRVSIALELLVNPSLLLLDEPTSGLDSTTAARIVSVLRRLAAEGRRTVVTTIHQPSARLYRMFDKVMLLSEGSPIYYGRASDALHYFSSIGFLSPLSVNPAEVMLDLANGIAPDSCKENSATEPDNGSAERERKSLAREELRSAYARYIATRLKADLCRMDSSSHSHAKGRREEWCTSWLEQFLVLLRRGIKERRYEAFNKLRIFQVISVATLGGLLWWHTSPSHIQDRVALLFFFSVFWGFFPLYNAVFTFPQERSMLIKERSSGMYRLSSYFLARTAGDLPMELALPTAFVVIIYWMGGLQPSASSFLLSLLVVLLSVLVSQSLGLAFGAILMDVKQATTLASVTTLVFLIAGGYYVQHIPRFIVWLKYLSFSFYCYKLLLGVQFRDDDVYQCSPGVLCRAADFPAIKSVGLHHMWIDVCIMVLMLIGYRLIAYLALHRLQPRC
ncbi:ABC transporter G family member 14-like isoform X2 [Phoenix dactylifera]|uniref:ABC transporter G family member 14-like isoform X2 n=1 Tax=Phoenix dactylifera TaxID=42345 RepID=A0A8B7CFQ2_PHODC|nr:ABC transporter G family member 14-like isoform X2 [Phoenix dactylifera]